MWNAEVVELADAPDSKSGDGDIVRVQVPPSAPPESLMKSEPLEFEINSDFFFYYILYLYFLTYLYKNFIVYYLI